MKGRTPKLQPKTIVRVIEVRCPYIEYLRNTDSSEGGGLRRFFIIGTPVRRSLLASVNR